jgi:hypothetical protein
LQLEVGIDAVSRMGMDLREFPPAPRVYFGVLTVIRGIYFGSVGLLIAGGITLVSIYGRLRSYCHFSFFSAW